MYINYKHNTKKMLQKQDKWSDIEQQPSFGNPQIKQYLDFLKWGGTCKFYKVWNGAIDYEKKPQRMNYKQNTKNIFTKHSLSRIWIQGEKSRKDTVVRENWYQQFKYKQGPKGGGGRDQVSGRVSVPAGMSHPLQMLHGNHS